MDRTTLRLAWTTVGAMFLLIGAGSLVTTTGSGLSIPDWPLAYNRLVPPVWHGGVAFEYGHRVVAGVVLVLTAFLVIRVWRRTRDRGLRSWVSLVAVLLLVQALLGGITVLLELPPAISIAHAGLAQATFATLIAFVHAARKSAAGSRSEPVKRHWWPPAVILAGVVFSQILLGALVRHRAAGLAVPDFPLAFGRLWPPREYFAVPYLAPKIWVHMLHRIDAGLVGLVIGAMAWFGRKRLAGASVGLVLLWGLQVLLGGWIVWSGRHWLPLTLHVLSGALLFAWSVWILMDTRVEVAA